jgi:CRISPR-associated protein (TIGR03986 family)
MSDKYEPSEKKFVNPYHFVGLQESCSRQSIPYKKQKGKLTGWVQCRLESLTPVFIPNTSSASECDDGKHSDVFAKDILKEKENKPVKVNSYDFFSYTDLSTLPGDDLKKPKEPVIPGSEIRGVIRSAFEAVTNSCLSTIDDEQTLFKRVTTNGDPGRLIFEDGNFKIQKCERLGIAFRWTPGDRHNFSEIINSLKEGQEVYIKRGHKYRTKKGFPAFTVVDDIDTFEKKGYEKGYFHQGEPFGEKKHHESIFVPTGEKDIGIDESAVKNYLENLELYKNKSVNLHLKKGKGEHTGYDQIDTKNKGLKDFHEFLIYYKKHNNKYYLSPAAIGREVFYNKLTKIIKRPEPYKGYEPCENPDHLCPACALFGLAGKQGAAASRVRFTDARTAVKLNKMEDYYDEVRILKELAGPKLSAAEFYLKQKPENAHLWNYDYAVNWRTNRDEIPGYDPEIRGRKFYWHQLHPHPYIEKEKDHDHKIVSDRNVAVRALRKGITFDFRVYFNEITEIELKRLLWVLTIGNRKENAHKIGMGKPLGMGSIKIAITEVMIRDILMGSETIEYKIKDRLEQFNYAAMNHEEIGSSQKVLEEFLFLTQLEHSFSGIIAYPAIVGEEEEENYKWFMENKKIKGTGTNPIIEKSLPPVTGPELPRYQKKTSSG